MANSPGAISDDDLSHLYKEYTGPLGSKTTSVPENIQTIKKSHGSSDEEEETHNPNAIPTDFTSRESKVWEAKSKATERNWKKRMEEEMICKICGESGHFTQNASVGFLAYNLSSVLCILLFLRPLVGWPSCPSTLGASRKSQDFFERVPARENHVKALFTEKVIQRIEKDIGCKIKIEEKFIIVSGKDRLILKKGVNAVHNVKDEGEKKDSSGSRPSRSRSPPPVRSLVGSRFGRSEPQRSHPSPQNTPQFQHRFNRQDKVVEDHVRDDLQKMTKGSPSAYGNDGARGRSSRSKSPTRHPYTAGNSYNLCDGHGQSMGAYKSDGVEAQRRGLDLQFGRNSEQPVFQQTLEELELEYKREATEFARSRDKEEDEENNRHREAVKEIRENHMKRLAILRGSHGKQWDEFLQLNVQRRQQQKHDHYDAGFGGYKQPPAYPPPEYNNPAAGNHDQYGGPNMLPMDSRVKFPNLVENSYVSSRKHDSYGDFPRQRREEYGKAYNRY